MIRMPYKFNWESPESLRVEFFGVVTFVDAINATEDLYNDYRSDEVRYAFWDFSAIDGYLVSETEVTEMAAMDAAASEYMKPMKAAFIIRDRNLAALGEYYLATLRELGCPWQHELFCSMDDARQWARP